MFEFLRPPLGGFRFTPLWWASAVLLLADAVILIFFSKYQQIGNILGVESALVLLYSLSRSRRRTG
jgi:hypothetical protein